MSKSKKDGKWNEGPPPFIGWWNASRTRNSGDISWRWWDGKKWSAVAFEESDTAESAADIALSQPAYEGGKPIEWRTYWPKNARVPRVDPSKAKAAKVKKPEQKKAKLRLVA